MKRNWGRVKVSVLGVALLATTGFVLMAQRSRSVGIGESKVRMRDRIDSKASGVTLAIRTQKRLLLSAEGSSEFKPYRVNRTNVASNSDGEIWLTVSYDDGTPFDQAKASDIQIETLKSVHDGEAARLDMAGSRPADGVWHFILPQLSAGDHFYRINVAKDIEAWKTSYEGHVVVHASYTRMPYWNAQRIDGTIWDPPH